MKKNSEKEIPLRLPSYDSTIFWKIDWKTLPVDFIFILFGIFFSANIFDGHDIAERISAKTLLAIYLVVTIIVCWYMGFILARYRVFYNDKINLAARWIFSIAGISLIGFLVALALPMVDGGSYNEDAVDRFSMFAVFMIVISPIFGLAGYATGTRAMKMANSAGVPDAKNKGQDELVYSILFALVIAVAFMMFAGGSEFVQQSRFSELWSILVFFGAALAAAASLIIMGYTKMLLIKIKIYYQLAFIFEVIFPLIIIASLIFWNEVQKHFFSGFSTRGTLGILFFSGILPFRILLIFNPPLRATNLLIGIVCFLFYIWSVS